MWARSKMTVMVGQSRFEWGSPGENIPQVLDVVDADDSGTGVNRVDLSRRSIESRRWLRSCPGLLGRLDPGATTARLVASPMTTTASQPYRSDLERTGTARPLVERLHFDGGKHLHRVHDGDGYPKPRTTRRLLS